MHKILASEMENRIGAQDSYSVMAANPVFLMGGYAALGFEARFMYDSFRLLASLSSFFLGSPDKPKSPDSDRSVNDRGIRAYICQQMT